jgi:hypothetical protein
MADLHLPLKGVYFDQIEADTKPFEFRLCTPFWRKRLEGRTYDNVVLTRGYPPAADTKRRLVLPWRGYEVQTIRHEHFGPEPVEVFAIKVQGGGAIVNPTLTDEMRRANDLGQAHGQKGD